MGTPPDPASALKRTLCIEYIIFNAGKLLTGRAKRSIMAVVRHAGVTAHRRQESLTRRHDSDYLQGGLV